MHKGTASALFYFQYVEIVEIATHNLSFFEGRGLF